MTSAIILAGGLGTRLRSVVSEVPKPLAPVQGRPFLEYLLDYWIGQGVSDAVLSVGYKHELIASHFGDSYKGIPIRYAVETSPLGTGGAIIQAVSLLEDAPFLILNGDTFFEVSLTKLNKFATESNPDWLLSLFRNTDSSRYMGISMTDHGRIYSFAPDPLQPLVNGGVYWVKTPSLLANFDINQAPISLEQQVFKQALAWDQTFYGMESTGQFIDIGIPDDFQRAQSIFVME